MPMGRNTCRTHEIAVRIHDRPVGIRRREAMPTFMRRSGSADNGDWAHLDLCTRLERPRPHNNPGPGTLCSPCNRDRPRMFQQKGQPLWDKSRLRRRLSQSPHRGIYRLSHSAASSFVSDQLRRPASKYLYVGFHLSEQRKTVSQMPALTMFWR